MEMVGFKPIGKTIYYRILLGSFGNNLSILDIGISNIDLVLL
jgi:hypothetical protein